MGRRPRPLATRRKHDLIALLNFCVLMIPIVWGAREVASRLALDLAHDRAAAAAARPGEPAELPERSAGDTKAATEPPELGPRTAFPDPVLGYGP